MTERHVRSSRDLIFTESGDETPGMIEMEGFRPVAAIIPLYEASDDKGEHVVVADYRRIGLPIRRMVVCLPGLCGHIECGDAAEISMN